MRDVVEEWRAEQDEEGVNSRRHNRSENQGKNGRLTYCINSIGYQLLALEKIYIKLLTTMAFWPIASVFFFSPGQAFLVDLACWEPETGRHNTAYATWIAATRGSAVCSVETGSATRTSNRKATSPSNTATRPKEIPFARGLSKIGTGATVALDLVSAAWADDPLLNVEGMVMGSTSGIS